MSDPVFHLSDEMILDYARGALEHGRELVALTHIAACPACRAEARRAEAVGGALLSELEPAELAPDALQRALARIETPPPPPPRAPRPRPDWIEVPPEVLRAAEHRRWAAPGVWVAPVYKDDDTGACAYLLRVAAGMAVPMHTHRGSEVVCVLKGAYADGPAVHRPGDIACNDETVVHRPRTTRDGECICLVSADAPLVPRDWVGRFFQPLVGI